MGPAGPLGPQGPQGERGPRGLQGEPGDRAEWLAQSGQSLANSGVLRFEPMGGSWVSANYGDTFEELIGLVFKTGDDYYLSGSIIADLRGVTTGEIYYLGTDGQLTTEVPGSGFVVVLGKGIGSGVLLFNPYLPVQNDAFTALSGSNVQLAGN